MKKTVIAVAVSMLAATAFTQAATVYKTDKASVDLYGRAYAGQFMGTKKNGVNDYSEKLGSNQFIRLGAKAESEINPSLTAIGQYEIQFNIGDSEKINNVSCSTSGSSTTCKDDKIRTRLAFAGLKSKEWGQVTFGRQKGAIAQIADWTDVALSDGYGANALGHGSDTFATARASTVFKYAKQFSGVNLEGSYKFDGNNTDQTTSAASDAAYGLSASYTWSNVSAGIGYNVGMRDKTGESDAQLAIVGVKYDDKAVYAALNYGKGSDFLSTGKDHTSLEAALGYNFDNGVGLMALYNKQKTNVSGAKTDTVDYYTLGAQYKFNKSLRVLGEYRVQNLNDTSASTAEATKNDFQVAVRYDF